LELIADATGIRISPHDLRRSFASVAESADISFLAIKALLNHAVGNDVTSGYVQMSVERLREPVQRVADKLKALCVVQPLGGANITKLRG
jgi:integrase